MATSAAAGPYCPESRLRTRFAECVAPTELNSSLRLHLLALLYCPRYLHLRSLPCPASPCYPGWGRQSPAPQNAGRSPGRTCPWGRGGGPGCWACSASGCGGRRSAPGRRRTLCPAVGCPSCSPRSPPDARCLSRALPP